MLIAIKKNKNLLFIMIIIGIIGYSPLIYQQLANPDAYCRSIMIGETDIIWVQQTRWMAYLWDNIVRSNYILPLFSSVVAIVFLCLSGVLIIENYNIINTFSKVLIICCSLFSLHTLSTMTYFYCSDIFCFAYFMAVLSAYILNKENSIVNFLLSIITMVLSLACYQAYISITAVLLIISAIIWLNSNRKDKEIVQKFFYFGMAFASSIVVYLLSVKFSLAIMGTEIANYRDMKTMGGAGGSEIYRRIIDAYQSFYRYLFTDSLFDNSWRFGKLWNFLCLVFIIVIVSGAIYQMKTYKNIFRCILVFLCLAFAPIAFNLVHLMTSSGVSFMMITTIPYVYVMLIVLLNQFKNCFSFTNIRKLMFVPIVILLFNNILISNILFVNMRMELNKAVSVASALNNAILSNEEYVNDMPIAIVGNYEDGNYSKVPYYDNIFGQTLGGTTYDFGFLWPEFSGINGVWRMVLMQYCGKLYPICSEEQYIEVIQGQEYKKMGVFPKQSSIKVIDGIMVIKMAEVVGQ